MSERTSKFMFEADDLRRSHAALKIAGMIGDTIVIPESEDAYVEPELPMISAGSESEPTHRDVVVNVEAPTHSTTAPIESNTELKLLTTTIKKTDWSKAACADKDPELFYFTDKASVKEAKSICNGCDIKEDCLEDALKEKIQWGVKGGKSERERTIEKNKRNKRKISS